MGCSQRQQHHTRTRYSSRAKALCYRMEVSPPPRSSSLCHPSDGPSESPPEQIYQVTCVLATESGPPVPPARLFHEAVRWSPDQGPQDLRNEEGEKGPVCEQMLDPGVPGCGGSPGAAAALTRGRPRPSQPRLVGALEAGRVRRILGFPG